MKRLASAHGLGGALAMAAAILCFAAALIEPARAAEDFGPVPELKADTKKIALDMITEAGVNLYFYTMATGVLKNDEDVIEGIIVESKAGRGVIRGKAFVDASADADLATWCGAPFEQLVHGREPPRDALDGAADDTAVFDDTTTHFHGRGHVQ